MSTTVEKNNPKIFPKNEGKINSKGMVAPPVLPKSHQTKFAGIKAIFEQNASHSQVNDSNTVSSNLGKTFGPTMRKLMEDGDINIHVSASTPSKQRHNSGDSGISSCSDVSGHTSDDEDRVIENINAFDQDNHQKSSDLHRVQATDELETIKFLKTLSKEERENFGFSPKQSDGEKIQSQSLSGEDTFPKLPACAYTALFPKPSKEKINELLGKNSYKALTSTPAQSTGRKSTPIWGPLNHNTVCIGKKPFNLENSMSSNSSSCSEKSNISDISDKSNNSNIVRCNITRSNNKKDFRKPDATHNDKPTGKKLSNVNVKELIRKFEQNNEIIKGR
ncbi:MAG: hypothetical protein LBU56_05400 [Rickettsiales bacterium]|jgi:hypothetical protein|nr:hypothetical protein [Rickettsiales bacterium]